LSHQRSSFDAALELLLAEIAETADYREPMSDDEAGAELTNLFRKYDLTADDPDHIELQINARKRVDEAVRRVGESIVNCAITHPFLFSAECPLSR
jgi:hypothetical protein